MDDFFETYKNAAVGKKFLDDFLNLYLNKYFHPDKDLRGHCSFMFIYYQNIFGGELAFMNLIGYDQSLSIEYLVPNKDKIGVHVLKKEHNTFEFQIKDVLYKYDVGTVIPLSAFNSLDFVIKKIDNKEFELIWDYN